MHTAWEPEDGRCRDCNCPLETEYEQEAGTCTWCLHKEEDDEEEDDEDPIADFYKAHGHF